MLYSTDKTKQIVKKDVAFLQAGIIDNAELTNIRYQENPNGNAFVEFKFEKDGKTMTHTEWAPRRGENMTDEAYSKKCTNQLARFEQILKCFYPGQDLSFNGENFAQLANWVITMYNNSAVKNTKLRIKVVYNDNGYTSLPQYAVYTFIEPMSVVEAGNSMIVELGIDNFTKVTPDKETKNGNPLESQDDSNDLPF